MEDKIEFERKIQINGETPFLTFQKELVQWLKMEKGTTIKMVTDKSKHGRTIVIWNPEQQKGDEQ